MTGRARPSNRVRVNAGGSLRPLITLFLAALALASLGGGWALARSSGVLGQKTVVAGSQEAPRLSLLRTGISDRFVVQSGKPTRGHHEYPRHSQPEPTPPEITQEEAVSPGVPVEESSPPNIVAQAIWTPAANAQVGVSVILDGTASTG